MRSLAISPERCSIAEDFTLTTDERRGKLQQLADNKIRLIREQQELENRQAELFALRPPVVRAEEELQDASSRWLSRTPRQSHPPVFWGISPAPNRPAFWAKRL